MAQFQPMVRIMMSVGDNQHVPNQPSAQAGPPRPSPVPEPQPPRLPTWRSEDLLATGNEAYIVHGEEVYRLRRTRSGKLVLFK